jgi:hypothetical protein
MASDGLDFIQQNSVNEFICWFQKKQGQTEKGKAVAAQVDSEVIPFKIGDLVSCSDNRGENRRMFVWFCTTTLIV